LGFEYEDYFNGSVLGLVQPKGTICSRGKIWVPLSESAYLPNIVLLSLSAVKNAAV